MSDKILSICIATYNRAAFIGATIESIIPQIDDRVELLIVDGASPDNTEAVVNGYQTNCPQLKYVRLPAKGGVDQDYDRAVELSQGNYCWLFTDDDLLKPGAVQTVLNAIEQEYSLIVVNAEIRNVDLSVRLSERKLSITSDRVYQDTASDKERFLAEIGDYLTFIGGVVIRRDLWLSRDRARYYGSRFIHVGVIFQNPLPGRMLAISQPLIEIRLGNAEWANLGFDIWMFKWPVLIWSFADFTDASKSAVCRKEPWRRLHSLIYYRSLGIYSLPVYSEWLKHRLAKTWQRAMARMMAQIPFSLANTLMLFYAKLNRNQLLKYSLQNSRSEHQRLNK